LHLKSLFRLSGWLQQNHDLSLMGLFALLPLGFLYFDLKHVSTLALILVILICLGVFGAKLRAVGSPRVPPTGKWWLALMILASGAALSTLKWPNASTYLLPLVGVAVFAVAMFERYFRYRLAKRRILKRRIQQARWRRAKRAVLSEWKERLRWLAGVQHDMRQPLHALGLLVRHPSITNGMETSTGRGLSSSQVVMQLLSCHRWLQELAENTLEATRLELGEQRENDIKHISSTELCESLVDWIKQLALSKGLEFQVQVEESQITTDLRRLKRVLGNLLFNAVEHTYEGRISFHYKRMGGVHQFEIKDTGPGIDEKIMNPEGGASSSFGSDLPKTGLGLYVVKRLCREMSWNLSLSNELHSGSKFVLELADRIPGQFVNEAPPIFKVVN
jgi:signal transduction histidine kinase